MNPPVRVFPCLFGKASGSLLLALAATTLLSTTAIAQSQNAADGRQPKNGRTTTTQASQGRSQQARTPYHQARFRTAPRPFSRPWITKLGGIAPSYRLAAANEQPTLAMPSGETLETVDAEPSGEFQDESDPAFGASVGFEDCWNGCRWCWWENLTLFGGVNSFKGPADQGENGNNGGNFGVNYSLPLSYYFGIGLQLGANFVESDFSGSRFDPNERLQSFYTIGVFRRTECGLQYGVVGDFLQDRYYVDMNISQIRAEISWVNGCGREWGVRVAASSGDDMGIEAGPITNLWQATDQFVLFHRRQLQSGGEAQLWAGGTGEKDGILGGDITVPISESFAITAAVNYLIPEEGTGPGGGHVTESWGLAINLVWYPGCRAHSETSNPFRPLFRVADNTSFLVDRMTQ